MAQYSVRSAIHGMESKHYNPGISLIQTPAIALRSGFAGYIFCSGFHQMRDHRLIAMTVNNNYFCGTSITQTTDNSSKITHKIFTCLDIFRTAFFTCLGKVVDTADTLKICFDKDLYLCCK